MHPQACSALSREARGQGYRAEPGFFDVRTSKRISANVLVGDGAVTDVLATHAVVHDVAAAHVEGRIRATAKGNEESQCGDDIRVGEPLAYPIEHPKVSSTNEIRKQRRVPPTDPRR